MPEFMILERHDDWARITLNRPDKRNALSIALRDEIADALDMLAADEAMKVVVVTGAGEVFCAGFDFKEFDAAFQDEDFSRRLWDSSDRYHRTLLEFPLPLVAALNGPALAGGFDLAVLCDLRVASTTARFAHPEYTFGDVVYGPLHDLVGGAVARELCLTGRLLDASEALDLRLVNSVVEPAELTGATEALVDQIRRAPRSNLLRTKAKAQRRAGIEAGATLDL